MPRFDRRSFLRRLGVGAPLLSPIVSSLLSEAHGQSAARKRVVFFITGNGIRPQNLTPAALQGDTPVESRSYAWPAMLKPLEPYRDRMLLLDGLANESRQSGKSHSMGYAALSCMPAAPGSKPGGEVPGGITIDQYIAGRIGTTTPRRSVLVGVTGHKISGAQYQMVFAADKEKPEPFVLDAKRLAQDLFGVAALDPVRGGVRQRALFDSLRHDIARLQGAFAGPERAKLDGYLARLEEMEKRDGMIAALKCTPPASPAGTSMEDRLASVVDVGGAALACGLTNVLGISCATGNPHSYFGSWSKVTAGSGIGSVNANTGHLPDAQMVPAMELFHAYNAGLIARLVATLSGIREGNGTAFDNTTIVYMSDNAENHHAGHKRWPLYVVGNSGGKLRADGRFLRYPKKGTAGARSMGDFFSTIATAVGAPTDSFGKGGFEPVTGPLGEILG